MLVNSDTVAAQVLPLVRDTREKLNNNANLSLTQPDGKGTGLTSLAQVSMASNISDLTYSESHTSFAYYKEDNSMALRAQSETDVHLHEETYNFDIKFSAEALGLTDKDFKNNQPMVMKFTLQQKQLDAEFKSSFQVVKQIRSPLDVLTDLAKALREVLRDGGNKTVAYELDDEARQSLLGDPKIAALVTQLIMIMASINLSKRQGEANHYLIRVSGKAKPLLDYREKTDIESKVKTVNMTITIDPPAQKIEPAESSTVTDGTSQTSSAADV